MKKLLYVSFENSENRASGVNKKISGQMQVFKADGYAVDLVARYQNGLAFYKADSDPEVINVEGSWRVSLCSWAAGKANEYDIAYIRFQFFCPFVLNMVKSFHKANTKTIMEIPTYPYNTELKKQGLRGLPKRMIDGTFKRACARYIDCFAAPLYGDAIMGVPCIEIRNGIDVDEIPAKKIQVGDDNKIHLLAVAMMAPWHGYDRMIKGLHNYYSTGGKEDFVLHLVGQGVASEEYHSLIEKYNLFNHVIEHGKLHGTELDEMYNIADIGIGSLGVHRTVIKKTNTLKIMEYMAKGIPVICEPSECGIPKESLYRLTVSDDEKPIDISELFKFYKDIYRKRTKDKVIEDIRNECRNNCNIKSGLKDVLIFMKQREGEKMGERK